MADETPGPDETPMQPMPVAKEPCTTYLLSPRGAGANQTEDVREDDSQTSLMSRGAPEMGYRPVGEADEGIATSAPAATRSGKLVLGFTVAVLLSGMIGFITGFDVSSTTFPKLRGHQQVEMSSTSHQVIAVVPAGVEAEAKHHEQVVTDAEEVQTTSSAPGHRNHTHHNHTDHHHQHHDVSANTSKNASNSSNTSNKSRHNETNETKHPRHVSPCNESAWPDKAEGLVCEDCKVPVNKFNYFYETCDNYCNMQGRKCMGAWEHDDYETCGEKTFRGCNEAIVSDVALCKCSVHINDTLKEEFEEKARNKVKSSCGKSEEDTDFWTDASLFQAAGVQSEDKCRSLCVEQHGCGAWTWGSETAVPGITKMCFLKKVYWGHKIEKKSKPGVISGYPFNDCKVFKPSYYYNPTRSARHHHKDEEDNDDFDQKGADHLMGVIRAKHGFCLDTEQPHGNGSLVEMMSCKSDSDSQVWKWDKVTGQVKNKVGLCLVTETFLELSLLRIMDCDLTSWNQQFSFIPKTGTFKNWRGPCLDAGERDRDHGAVYLRSCNKDNWNQQFEMGDLKSMSIPKVVPKRHPTLYCFALMLPHSYEQGLLAMQYEAKVSLFSCEAYSVFSNQAIQVAHGLTSHVVDSDLKCEKGGEFGTALNLDIFIAVWKKVVEGAVFMDHDWTIKVDPDAVFFPERLRGIVALHPETEKGVYLNNCKFGLHGPIEVFSRNAVFTWSTGHRHCVDHFWKLCHGDCLWGEDLFIDQCLSKVLGARRENDYRILTEDHCDPPKNWDSCSDTSRVAFHPFKNDTMYRKCLNNAEKAIGGTNFVLAPTTTTTVTTSTVTTTTVTTTTPAPTTTKVTTTTMQATTSQGKPHFTEPAAVKKDDDRHLTLFR